MLFDDLPGDGQSQANPPKEIVPTVFKMVEAAKDKRQIVLRNANAMILHRNDDQVFLLAHAHFHVSSSRTELNGIINQGHEGTLDGL